MPLPSTHPRRFAVALSTAIASSGLSLSQVAGALAERGLSVTPASLSYWKTGRSLPRRASSRPIVRELEDLFGLPDKHLLFAIRDDLNDADATAAADQIVGDDATSPAILDHESSLQFETMATDMNWENEVHREVMEETMRVSADFRTITSDCVVLVRIPERERPTYHVGSFWTEGELDPESVGIRNLEGAVVAGIERVDAEHSEMARLEIPPDYATPDSLHRIAYSHRYDAEEPFAESITRLYNFPLRFYTLRVVFEGEAPSGITWNLTSIEHLEGSTRRTTISKPVSPIGNAVQVSLENLASAIGVFSWTLP